MTVEAMATDSLRDVSLSQSLQPDGRHEAFWCSSTFAHLRRRGEVRCRHVKEFQALPHCIRYAMQRDVTRMARVSRRVRGDVAKRRARPNCKDRISTCRLEEEIEACTTTGSPVIASTKAHLPSSVRACQARSARSRISRISVSLPLCHAASLQQQTADESRP